MLGLLWLHSGASSFVLYLVLIFLAILGILGGILTLKRPIISMILMFLSLSVGLVITLVEVSVGDAGWDLGAVAVGFLAGSPITLVGLALNIIVFLKSRNKKGILPD